MSYGGGGGNRRRGRPRRARIIETEGMWRCYAPCCGRGQHPRETVTLLPEELEAFRLVDCEGLDQESAAERMHVSRRTLWRDIHTARSKVADALSEGKIIAIQDCGRTDQDVCILSEQEDGNLPQPEG
ncbi:DUF134 domain-containing protein [Methanogenium marinum]|uniref:UPF0251 protein L0665_03370 n=1 Tax=Methanogenium marinum TaxID=348610 RepID=A0A9Q4KSC8_9EURY|nr:DUF134 domain-containing protein [Methanogenium marinum]MDE4907651.1 DUF134 domain-containing protein [Methanogenium marinum]